MSAPAANARSPPPSTIARISGSRVELLERGDDCAHQLAGERVQLLRPVHQHDADAAVAFDEN